jgi:hypothetical protein
MEGESMRRAAFVLVALALVSSCGGSPADVAGSYTVNLTNGANGCGTDGWMEGSTTTAVPIEITQDGSSFTATVTGLAATYLDVAVGAHVFTGPVSGSHLDGTLRGTGRSMGSCAYTLNVDLDADLDGDVLVGELRWYADTNSSPDCGMYATCSNLQSFNGTRPPTR